MKWSQKMKQNWVTDCYKKVNWTEKNKYLKSWTKIEHVEVRRLVGNGNLAGIEVPS